MDWYQLTEHGVWGHTALAEAADAVVIPELNLTLTLVQIYEEVGIALMKAGFSAGDER